MSIAPGHNPGDQRPNLWEELNRPRANADRMPPPPPPSPGPPEPDRTTKPAAARLDGTATSAAGAMKRIDSQALLLVGAALFVVIALAALSVLGGSSPAAAPVESVVTTTVATTMPEQLAVVEETTTTAPPAEPSTTAGAPTAMGLPAALLDGPQSQVYRLYRTALGREPDRRGFQFWSDEVRAGEPIEALARQFVASDEFRAQFAEGAGPDQRMAQLLTNAFGPADSAEQMQAWLERYRGLDGAALLLAISEADETLAITGTLR